MTLIYTVLTIAVVVNFIPQHITLNHDYLISVSKILVSSHYEKYNLVSKVPLDLHNSDSLKVCIRTETHGNVLTMSSYERKNKLHTSNIQCHRINTDIPTWKNHNIARNAQTTVRQTPSSQILQLHVQPWSS